MGDDQQTWAVVVRGWYSEELAELLAGAIRKTGLPPNVTVEVMMDDTSKD